jgi:hypothetical protein
MISAVPTLDPRGRMSLSVERERIRGVPMHAFRHWRADPLQRRKNVICTGLPKSNKLNDDFKTLILAAECGIPAFGTSF